jgi:hypothetical protein
MDEIEYRINSHEMASVGRPFRLFRHQEVWGGAFFGLPDRAGAPATLRPPWPSPTAFAMADRRSLYDGAVVG